MSDTYVRDSIRRAVIDYGRLGIDAGSLRDDTDLYGAGMTSHASVNVMLAIEGAFDLEFPDRMLTRSVFTSVDTIAAAIPDLSGADAASSCRPRSPAGLTSHEAARRGRWDHRGASNPISQMLAPWSSRAARLAVASVVRRMLDEDRGEHPASKPGPSPPPRPRRPPRPLGPRRRPDPRRRDPPGRGPRPAERPLARR